MALSWQHYFEQLRELLPRGRLWRAPLPPVLSGVFEAIAREWSRVDGRAGDALDEAFANTVDETIERWEDVYQLDSSGALGARVARVVARSQEGRTSTHEDYRRELAPLLGEITIRQYTPAEAAAAGHPDWVYWLFITPTAGGTYAIADAQAQADRIRHAHEKVSVYETADFLCDDPASLCDRDLLAS